VSLTLECKVVEILEEQKLEEEKPSAREEELIGKVADFESKVIRLQADMDNMRRRHQREKEELWDMAVADCICQLLPALDNFDRAVKVLPEGDWTQGMVMVHKQLGEILHRLGLEYISAVGPFNPQSHEAIAVEEEATLPENTVTQEFERGYKYRGKVIRPSKVRVSMGGRSCE